MKKKTRTKRSSGGNTIQGKDEKGGAATKKKQVSIQQEPDSLANATTAALPVSNVTSPLAPNNKNNVAVSAANARQEVEKWAKRALDKGVNGLREEFMELKRYVPPDMTTNAFQAHWDAGRNRYKDVPCQDKCRIVLNWPGQQHDYIHANYVATPISAKRFICAQGPLPNTAVDFWHMVIQEDSESVVMLCNVKEKGMDKCAQYWPLEEKEVMKFEDVEVTNTFVRALSADEPSVRVSVLNIKWKIDGKEKSREVRHYQWVDWPDRGVPACRLTAMVLLSSVRGTKKPIVVHCSAGIGRTGSIVAIEFILERLQSGLPCEAMDELLKELRKQRPYSIQTDLQYLFVHRVMLFYFFEKYKTVANSDEIQAKYKTFIEAYDKAVA